ncbi:hypothetical protein J6590_066206 [Homalodisca vitripennis]|nr:hypothetical protein J6590_066206 [Homalodisca vitripennis]
MSLHKAVAKSSVEEMEALLDSGAKIDSQDYNGQTALFSAIRANFDAGVDILLARGCDVNIANDCNETPLHLAACKFNLGLFEKLLNRGAKLECKNIIGETPLHSAVVWRFSTGVKLLLERGASVHARDCLNCTPVDLALKSGSVEMLLLLLDYGAELPPNVSKFGETPLHVVARLGHVEMVEELLMRGASVTVEDDKGINPLQASWKQPIVHQILMEHVVKLNAVKLVGHVKGSTVIKGMLSFKKACFREINRIRERRIGAKSLYTVFSILGDPTFVFDERFAEVIASKDLKKQFPLYAIILKSCFEIAKKRLNMLNILMECFPLPLPPEMKRKIFISLCDHDLKNLLEVVKMQMNNSTLI